MSEVHPRRFLRTIQTVAELISEEQIDRLAAELVQLRAREGRLFILGVGGGAGHASHAVNDFRKLCNIEAYAPTDNPSEITARVNDEGWETVFVEWLRVSHLGELDAIMIFSVGGGTEKVSVGLVRAIRYAKSRHATVMGVVGPKGGRTADWGDVVIRVPVPIDLERWMTPITEAFQAVIWHCLVCHPSLQQNETKW